MWKQAVTEGAQTYKVVCEFEHLSMLLLRHIQMLWSSHNENIKAEYCTEEVSLILRQTC